LKKIWWNKEGSGVGGGPREGGGNDASTDSKGDNAKIKIKKITQLESQGSQRRRGERVAKGEAKRKP